MHNDIALLVEILNDKITLIDRLWDLLPTIIAGLIPLIVLWLTLRNHQKSEKNKLLLIKIEEVYTKFQLIHGDILYYRKQLLNKNVSDLIRYPLIQLDTSEMTKQIELLNIETKLFFKSLKIEMYKNYTKQFISKMEKINLGTDHFKDMYDAEYAELDEEVNGRKVLDLVHPSTFDIYYQSYKEQYSKITEMLEKLAGNIIGQDD